MSDAETRVLEGVYAERDAAREKIAALESQLADETKRANEAERLHLEASRSADKWMERADAARDKAERLERESQLLNRMLDCGASTPEPCKHKVECAACMSLRLIRERDELRARVGELEQVLNTSRAQAAATIEHNGDDIRVLEKKLADSEAELKRWQDECASGCNVASELFIGLKRELAAHEAARVEWERKAEYAAEQYRRRNGEAQQLERELADERAKTRKADKLIAFIGQRVIHSLSEEARQRAPLRKNCCDLCVIVAEYNALAAPPPPIVTGEIAGHSAWCAKQGGDPVCTCATHPLTPEPTIRQGAATTKEPK